MSAVRKVAKYRSARPSVVKESPATPRSLKLDEGGQAFEVLRTGDGRILLISRTRSAAGGAHVVIELTDTESKGLAKMLLAQARANKKEWEADKFAAGPRPETIEV